VGTEIPDYVTHYYRSIRPPFLNLSDLPEESIDDIIGQLANEHAGGASSRLFGRRYMELRRLTEERLRRLFVEGGGRPTRDAPHYFVLGSSRWYEGLANDMASLTLDLSDLPKSATSFTVPDSFTAMGLGQRFGLYVDPRPYHGKVFQLSELREIIERYGMPVDDIGDYAGYQSAPFEKYIEIQLWEDQPVTGLGSL
jgi:hypothetical protein